MDEIYKGKDSILHNENKYGINRLSMRILTHVYFILNHY
jgi:hypothetical protein